MGEQRNTLYIKHLATMSGQLSVTPWPLRAPVSGSPLPCAQATVAATEMAQGARFGGYSKVLFGYNQLPRQQCQPP